MLISRALAFHPVYGDEASGGGTALLIIIAVGITLTLVYVGQKKLRKYLVRRYGSGK